MSSATESDWETTESSDSSQRSDSEGPEPHQEISTPDDDISKVTYHPDGRRVISRADDGTIRVWNLEDGEQEGASIEHESIIVDSLSVTSDGTRIIGGDENGCIRVWDVESHEVVQEWTHPESFCEIAISPDDQLIAVGSWMVFIYTMGGTQVNHSIKVGKTIWCISFSPSSGKLACGTRSDVYVYDVDDGTLILGPLQGHEHCVRCVLWSRDGSRLFSGSDDETIRCWNTDTGEQIGRLWTGHTNCILSLSLSPDGSILASASSDETVRFWDSTSGHVIGQDLQHDDDVNAVSFSPSGEFVASATGDGTIYLWPVPRLDSVESSERHTTNFNSILPDLSLGLDERQRIFEVRLRKVLDLATSKGFHVDRDLFPSSLPVGARNTSLTGMERIADASGDSNAMDASPMEPSTSVLHAKSNGDDKESRKVDKIIRKLVNMLRDIFFKSSRGDHSK